MIFIARHHFLPLFFTRVPSCCGRNPLPETMVEFVFSGPWNLSHTFPLKKVWYEIRHTLRATVDYAQKVKTVEPPNNGHTGNMSLVLCREAVLFPEVGIEQLAPRPHYF